MRWSLIASTLVHTAILLAGVISFSSPDELESSFDEAAVVDLVDPSEISQAVALAKDGEEDIENPATRKQEAVRLEAGRPEEEQPEQKPEEAKTEEPAPKEPEPKPEPEPEPKPVEVEKEPEPVPEPQEVKKEPEPEPAPDPEPKPVEAKPEPEKPKVAAPKPRRKPKKKLAKKKPKKKRKFDADALTALLDKSVDKTTPQRASDGSGTPRKAERNAIGDKAELSATERDWLIDKINRCYSIPAGVEDARLWRVTMQFRTDGSGQVFGVPVAVKSSGGAQGKIAVETATRALFKCAPYDRFESFKSNEFRINFDPDSMVNG